VILLQLISKNQVMIEKILSNKKAVKQNNSIISASTLCMFSILLVLTSILIFMYDFGYEEFITYRNVVRHSNDNDYNDVDINFDFNGNQTFITMSTASNEIYSTVDYNVNLKKSDESTIELKTTEKNKEISNPVQSSNYAYVTLISGIDETFKYRGFLYNALIMKKALKEYGSTADFIAMIGFSVKNTSLFESDLNLLKKSGIIVHVLPRLLTEEHELNFAEMALLKITPYSFVNYEKIQFFDGDVCNFF
jgi:hypothetical protein